MLNFIEQTTGDEYKIIKASNGKEAILKLNELNIYVSNLNFTRRYL